VVVAAVDGIPDLLRIVAWRNEDPILVADGDPGFKRRIPRSDVLAVARLPFRAVPRRIRAARRLWLDLQEARSGVFDNGQDLAGTVRNKYETQAPFYATSRPSGLSTGLIDALHQLVPRNAPILVAGSGTGHECFQLTDAGWSVVGIDFSPRMIQVAQQEGTGRAADVRWVLGDLRHHDEVPGSLGAVVFTNDVYSFLPDPGERVDLLRRMARWLTPKGVLLLSARRVRRSHDARMLDVQHRAARRRGISVPWGASHTRWIAPDGRIQRSFVMVFRERALAREIAAAGLSPGCWMSGHRIVHRSAATSQRPIASLHASLRDRTRMETRSGMAVLRQTESSSHFTPGSDL
jgi:SAM-dependent methyltransferase